MAPEGTRTLTAALGPFKKGAFHLAIQAGVPIVPVVIHNSGDVQPKTEFAMRPATVHVDVLPPVDTSRWRAATVDRHVRAVRNMFLRCLGQPQERVVPRTAAKGRSKRRDNDAVRATTREVRKGRPG
jgi:putative phosphoserine phosphatase/1-acylglycerol-3-phosphate O-acyltransferase